MPTNIIHITNTITNIINMPAEVTNTILKVAELPAKPWWEIALMIGAPALTALSAWLMWRSVEEMKRQRELQQKQREDSQEQKKEQNKRTEQKFLDTKQNLISILKCFGNEEMYSFPSEPGKRYIATPSLYDSVDGLQKVIKHSLNKQEVSLEVELLYHMNILRVDKHGRGYLLRDPRQNAINNHTPVDGFDKLLEEEISRLNRGDYDPKIRMYLSTILKDTPTNDSH